MQLFAVGDKSQPMEKSGMALGWGTPKKCLNICTVSLMAEFEEGSLESF